MASTIGAVFRRVASTLPKHALREHSTPMIQQSSQISLEHAIEEHEIYMKAVERALSTAGSPVTTEVIPEDDNFPDCVFVEDAAIVVGNKGLLCNSGAPSRRGEEKALLPALSKWDINVTDMQEFRQSFDDMPTCDGGDVMFTGRHIIVGLSGRTNESGAQCVKNTFEGDYPVVIVPRIADDLHFKCAITHVDHNNLIVADTADGRTLANTLNDLLHRDTYTLHMVTDTQAANVVRVNDTLLVPAEADSRSKGVYEQAARTAGDVRNIVEIPNSQLAMCDGSLTCRSILIREY